MLLRAIVACAVLTGCSGLAPSRETRVATPPFPDCAADVYAFAGRGTLRGLGLVGHSVTELPEPDREAMIWVTADRRAFADAPDGAAERARMLCFAFGDGSGGSEWPIDDAWVPPGASVPAGGTDPGVPLLLIGLASVAVIGLSAVAFRRR